jgi:hypothetical protein
MPFYEVCGFSEKPGKMQMKRKKVGAKNRGGHLGMMLAGAVLFFVELDRPGKRVKRVSISEKGAQVWTSRTPTY